MPFLNHICLFISLDLYYLFSYDRVRFLIVGDMKMSIISRSEERIGCIYETNNLSPVSFFNRQSQYDSPYVRNFRGPVEMFRPYPSFAEIKNGIRAPLAMPFLCLSFAAIDLHTAFRKIAMAALQFGTFSPVYAARSFKQGIEALLSAVYIALKSVFETIRAVIVLATRSISTASFISFVAGYIAGYFAIMAGIKTFEAGASVINHFRRPKDTERCNENAYPKNQSTYDSTHALGEIYRGDYATQCP